MRRANQMIAGWWASLGAVQVGEGPFERDAALFRALHVLEPLCRPSRWHLPEKRVGIHHHRWTERVADDTGNRDAFANCLADLYDDKRSSVRCRRHSCADVAHTERQCRLLDFSRCCGELHFGSAYRVVDRPSNARPLLATAEGR